MVISRGDDGDQVVEVQRLLQSWGFQIADDGRFGAETENAVQNFQSSVGIEVDGLVGPDTLAALRQRSKSSAEVRLALTAVQRTPRRRARAGDPVALGSGDLLANVLNATDAGV